MTGKPNLSENPDLSGLLDGYRLHELLGSMIPGIVMICQKKTLQIEFANQAFYQLFGSNCMSASGFIDPDVQKKINNSITSIHDEGFNRIKVRHNSVDLDFDVKKVADGYLLFRTAEQVKVPDEKDKLIHELTTYKQMIQEKETFLGQGSFELNMLTGVQQVSPGMLNMYGLNEALPSPGLYYILRNFFDAGEQRRVLEFFRDLSEVGMAREIEVTSFVNGSRKDLEIFAKVYRNPDGKTERLAGTVKDISAIKELYNQMLVFKNELKKRELTLKHGTWEYDLSSKKYQISDGLYRVFDMEAGDDSEAFDMSSLYVGSEKQRVDEAFQKVMLEGSAYVDDLKIKTRIGEIKYVEIFCRIIKDGGPEKIIGITRDVTRLQSFKKELKDQVTRVDIVNQELSEAKEKLESQLEELEKANLELQLYKQTMLDKDEFLNQGTWEWDLKTNMMDYSRGIYRLFGYHHKDEMKEWDANGKDISRHLDEEERKRSNEDWEKILREADTYLREMEIITKDGFQRRLETFGKVFRDENGNAYKVIGTTRDITKLKEYEQELEVKIDELNRSNRDLEEFAYIASHDLHEPLRKLSTFGQRLSNSADGELSSVNRDYLDRMLRATENMRNLIDNLLEFSRVTRGAATFVKSDLNKLVEEVIAEQELRIEEAGAVVTVQKMPELEVVPSQLKQIFNNLLNNALKFIQLDTRPVIEFKCAAITPEERSRYKLKMNREYVKISVQDNGIGFDKVYAEKIFQIFQRLHGKSDYSGSGIGLAICRKIADNHKGLIFAESGPGRGSVFTLILPNKP